MSGAQSLDSFWGPVMERQMGGNLTVVDKVPPEMIHLIHAHWYHFPPLDKMWHVLLGLVIACLGLVSWCGNFVVIYIFGTTKALRTPSNILVMNLAFSDFLMMVMMSPPMVINCYYETWVLGPLMCDLYAMFGSLFGCVSIWTMTMIALDRYNVIVKGMAGKPLTTGGALMRIVGIYCFGLIWTVAPVLGWNKYVPEGNMTSCGTDYFSTDWNSRSYIYVYSFFVYSIPLGTICYSYWFILAAVSAHEKAMKAQAKKMNVASLRSGEDASKSAEGKLAKVALVTISLWFMAWTPYMIVNFIGNMRLADLSPLATIWPSVFAKASAVYNPIVYGISHPKYRAVLNEKMPCFVCGKAEDPDKGAGDNASQTTEAPVDA